MTKEGDLSDDKPAPKANYTRCRCGSRYFFVAECERIEGAGGLPGFFDEGVLVGRCADCGRMQAFIFSD